MNDVGNVISGRERRPGVRSRRRSIRGRRADDDDGWMIRDDGDARETRVARGDGWGW